MNASSYLSGRVAVHAGDCLDVVRKLPAMSVDSVVSDPPYALVSIAKRSAKAGATGVKDPEGGTGAYARASAGFMGKTWDTGERAFAVEFWAEVHRVLKPGGHVLAFAGTRTYHRLVCAIEDAGFEIRDQIGWAYGSGFPKSHDVSKGMDARTLTGSSRTEDMRRIAMGAEYKPSGRGRANYDHGGGSAMNGASGSRPRTDEACRWQGWGTALKPAWEPIVVARKPLIGTVAENVLRHGTGALNIDGCRVDAGGRFLAGSLVLERQGRWPANLIHDGSTEVIKAFPETESGTFSGKRNKPKTKGVYGSFVLQNERGHVGDAGSAARFFYSAKADADDRIGSKHPTVKPVDLMRWLVRLVTPPRGVVLDPFAGTGTTGEAAFHEGFSAVLIEREAEYLADIERRMGLVLGGPDERRHAILKAKGKVEHAGPLFQETAP